MKNPDWQHMQKGDVSKMKKWTPEAFHNFAVAENIFKEKKKNKGWKRKVYWAKKQGWSIPQRPTPAADQDEEADAQEAEEPPSTEEPPSKRARAVYEESGNQPAQAMAPMGRSPFTKAYPPVVTTSRRPMPPGCYLPKSRPAWPPLPQEVPMYPRDAAGITFHYAQGKNFFLPHDAAKALYHAIPKAKLEAWARDHLRPAGSRITHVEDTDPIIEILDEEDEETIRPWHRFP